MCWSNCLQGSSVYSCRPVRDQLWAEQFLFTAASSSCRNSGQSVEHEWLTHAAITGTFVPHLYLWGLGNLLKKKEKECNSQRKGSYIMLPSGHSVATAHLHSEGRLPAQGCAPPHLISMRKAHTEPHYSLRISMQLLTHGRKRDIFFSVVATGKLPRVPVNKPSSTFL